jgi:hypothetical protein
MLELVDGPGYKAGALPGQYARIPVRTMEALNAYGDERYPIGGFLQAVLENRLAEAFARADAENLAALRDIVMYVRWVLPGECSGSPEAVAKWLGGRK